jgi:tRNA A37 methylthiotransferase MiaB
MRPHQVYLFSSHLACKPNKVLTCKLFRYLTLNRHEVTQDLSRADFVILNTCGFTQAAEDHSIALFKEYLERGKEGSKVISAGCLNRISPEAYQNELNGRVVVLEKESDLDLYLKNEVAYEDIREAYIGEDIVAKLNTQLYAQDPHIGLYSYFQNAIKSAYPLLKKSTYLRTLFNDIDHTEKFFVQIGSGCVGKCSYCIIKKARGSPVSRPVEDILRDIGRVYTPGQSLYLVADDCGSYGQDTGQSLFYLLERIHQAYPELTIDLNYLNPVWLIKNEKDFLRVFKEMKIGSVNVSIQSGSNRIISKMNRHYDVKKIKAVVKELKRISPSSLIWTHLIVGFPGETWVDFLKSLSLVHTFRFVYAFPYSDRKGTESCGMDNKNGQVPVFLKKVFVLAYSIGVVTGRGAVDLTRTILLSGTETETCVKCERRESAAL